MKEIMSGIQANPLRVSTFIFTAVIILLMIVHKFIPANYTVAVDDSLYFNMSENAITLHELHYLLNQDEIAYQLIDIRTAKEFQEGHIPNAVNIPAEELLHKKSRKQLKENTNLIYCSSEHMAYSTSFLLRQLGYNCSPINGNYEIIKEAILDSVKPELLFYSQEKQKFNYPLYIKQIEAPQEFSVDIKEEIKTQSGC
jgi:rhodanese-related sulfurtransferase